MALVANAELMAATSNHIKGVSGQMNGEFAQLKNAVESSRGSWEGGAAAKFQSIMERYDHLAQQQREALETMAEKIGEAGKGYDEETQSQLAALHAVEGESGSLGTHEVSSSLRLN